MGSEELQEEVEHAAVDRDPGVLAKQRMQQHMQQWACH